MEQPQPTSYDRPAVVDRLGFDVYVRQIVSTIRDATARNQLPLTIGIYGRWGSGKTSLMLMVKRRLLNEELPTVSETSPDVKLTWLQYWRKLSLQEKFYLSAHPLSLAALIALGLSVVDIVVNWIARAIPSITINWSQAIYFSSILCTVGILLQNHLTMMQLWIARRPPTREQTYRLLGESLLGIPLGFLVTGLMYLLRDLMRLEGGRPPSLVVPTLAFLVGFFARQLAIAGDYVLRRGQPKQPRRTPPCQVIEFNAWKYANEDELWAALLQCVLSQLEINAYGWKRFRIKLQLWWRTIEWKSGLLDVARKLAPTVGKALLVSAGIAAITWLFRAVIAWLTMDQAARVIGTLIGFVFSAAPAVKWISTNVAAPLADLDLDKYRKKLSYKDHLTFLAEFSQEFAKVTQIARRVGYPIVLMLDDLDRCLPDQAVSVLEAIKLFIGDDAPVVFLIGADREYIERAIEVKYADLIEKMDANDPRRERFLQMGHEYLEKIVQLPFNLPPIESGRIDKFIDETFADDPRVTDLSQIFTAGLLPNPRQVLRVINIFRFVAGLANERGDLYFGTIDLGLLAKLVIIQYRWPGLYADVVDHPELLGTIEGSYQAGAIIPDDLKPYVTQNAAKHDLRRLLTLPPSLVGVDLKPYLFLTARAQSQSQTATPTKQEPSPTPTSQPIHVPSISSDTADTLNVKAQALRDQIQQLSGRGADSALVTHLLADLEKVRGLLVGNDLPSADALLGQIESAIGQALDELKAREEQDAPRVIKAKVSKEGRLMFDRALSYERVEIRIDSAQLDQPLRFTATTSRGKLDWIAAPPVTFVDEYLRPQNSQPVPNYSAMSDGLGRELGKLMELSEFRDPGIRLRFRLTCEPPIDNLPWEWANLSPDQVAIGIDPRHCFVRGRSLPTPSAIRAPVRSSKLNLLLAITSPAGLAPIDIEFIPVALEPIVALGAIQIKRLERATLGQLTEEIKQGVEIVHLIAPIHISGDECVVGFEDRDGQVEEVRDVLAATGVRVVMLDIASGQDAARGLAEGGVPAVVSWQQRESDVARRAFILAFYNALLRTGQADFAITEGRRAIASQTKDWMKAGLPVMYLNADDGIVFSNLA